MLTTVENDWVSVCTLKFAVVVGSRVAVGSKFGQHQCSQTVHRPYHRANYPAGSIYSKQHAILVAEQHWWKKRMPAHHDDSSRNFEQILWIVLHCVMNLTVDGASWNENSRYSHAGNLGGHRLETLVELELGGVLLFVDDSRLVHHSEFGE